LEDAGAAPARDPFMKYTIVYMSANQRPHFTCKVEVEADSHEEALRTFINLPGHENDFVAATIAGSPFLVGNTLTLTESEDRTRAHE
jgi:hypothetical protein